MKDKNIKEKLKDEPFDSAQGKLDECNKKCDEYLNNWKRERADFLNYKKNEIERVGFLGQYLKEDIILKILPILDNIYLAEKQLPPARNASHSEAGGENLKQDNWTKGFLQIETQIAEFLKKEGIEEIEAMGKKFDLNLMEAIGEIEGSEQGIVIEEVQKGYIMQDKVIRPAKVKIGK